MVLSSFIKEQKRKIPFRHFQFHKENDILVFLSENEKHVGEVEISR